MKNTTKLTSNNIRKLQNCIVNTSRQFVVNRNDFDVNNVNTLINSNANVK